MQPMVVLQALEPRDVFVLLKFSNFSPESTQTWSLGATESEV